MQNQDETTPSLVSADEEIQIPSPEKKPRKRWFARILLGILVFIIIVALGGLGGYLNAVTQRINQEDKLVSTEVAQQFVMGLVNIERGEYEIARQRFEYILEIQPDNTAAAEKLTEILLLLNQSGTPIVTTSAPSATLVPTVDTRNLEELYAQALAFRDQQNWTALLETLDSLRSADAAYKVVEVDGMYYLAYRNRGMYRIQVEGNLEGGIFDITRAEMFGPLDVDASSYRRWAEDYLTGVSFWAIDWNEVVNYFAPLAINAPYLSDSNHFTSQDRLATAQIEQQLTVLNTARLRYSQHKYCESYDLYVEASQYLQLTQEDQAKFLEAKNQCFGIPPTPESTPEPTPTSEGGG